MFRLYINLNRLRVASTRVSDSDPDKWLGTWSKYGVNHVPPCYIENQNKKYKSFFISSFCLVYSNGGTMYLYDIYSRSYFYNTKPLPEKILSKKTLILIYYRNRDQGLND